MAIKQLTADETAYFCEQLAAMLGAGLQLNDGLDILAEDIGDRRMKHICEILSENIYKEQSLYGAMSAAGCFPKYAVEMVKIGMLTGRMEAVLLGLAEFYENRAELKRTLRTAILHPLLLLVMMTVVIIVLVVQVIPMFSDIFARFDGGVRDTVNSAVANATAVGTGILIALVAIIAVTAVIMLLANIPAARSGMESLCCKIPLLSRIIRRFSQAKLANAMSVMVQSGIAPEEALEYAELVITDRKMLGQLRECRSKVIHGGYFADAICESGLFPQIYGKSLKIAYTAGSFDTAWKKISDRCNEAADRTASSIISFAEPAIIIILAAMIGSILLTVMLPLMNIMSVL